MPFDIPTLLLAATAVTLICACARALLWHLNPTLPGLGHWTLSSFIGGSGLILAGGRSLLPPILSQSLPTGLIILALVITWFGFRLFLRRPWMSVNRYRLLMVGPPLVPILLHGHAGNFGNVVSAGLIAVFSALVSRELLYKTPNNRIALRVTGSLFLANTLFALIRMIFVGHEETAISQVQITGFTAVSLLWWMFMVLSVTMGMVLMTGELLQENLDRQASQDPLTGALNRRAFDHLCVRELARARRGKQSLSVLMMDLDHFKRINDQLGHATGDIVLRLFVSVSIRVLRQEDVFCRWGGEEFVTLLPNTAGPQARLVAERLRDAFAREAAGLAPEVADMHFTVSIGMAEMENGEEVEDMMRRADDALYRAKKLGRNRCEMALPVGVNAPMQTVVSA